MSKYSSSIAKYNEIIEYQNYDDYISDMEIYQILNHLDLNHSNSNVNFIISSGNVDEEMDLTTSACSSNIIKRSHKPSIK